MRDEFEIDGICGMLLLALDTSSKSGSVALFYGNQFLLSHEVEGSGKSAAQLTPTIQSVLNESAFSISDLHYLAVATGPGSFTGIRVGVVTAKVMAYSLGCQVVGVNSMAAIALDALEDAGISSVCAVMDAQRRQLFACQFTAPKSTGTVPGSSSPNLPVVRRPIEIIEPSQLFEFADGSPLVGPGLEKLSEQMAESKVLDRQYWSCSAKKVGRYALRQIESGINHDFWSLKPEYFRPSAAEEKRAEREVQVQANRDLKES